MKGADTPGPRHPPLLITAPFSGRLGWGQGGSGARDPEPCIVSQKSGLWGRKGG